MKRDQAVLNIDDVSCNRGSGVRTDTKDDCQYTKLDEVQLPDGTKMKFFVRRDNAPTFDEIMNEIYDLASDALIRKLSK